MYALPFPQGRDRFGLPPRYHELLTTAPLTKVRTPAGDEAWLACGYDIVKELATNPALRRGHPQPERAARINDSVVQGGPTEQFEGELERHQRMRRLLTPAFSAKRMRALQEDISERVGALLDEFPSPPLTCTPAWPNRFPPWSSANFSVPPPRITSCSVPGRRA